MKNMFEFVSAMNEKDRTGMEYLAGVPAAEKRLYWSDSPWSAFHALTARG